LFGRLLLFSVLIGLAVISFTDPAVAASPSETWGFYVTYDPASRQSLLTHLHQLNVVVPDYFGLTASNATDGANDPTLDSAIKAAGVRLFPMIQNRARFVALSPTLNDPVQRATAVSTLVNLAQRYRYDGLTLDFEGVSPDDRAGLTAFVEALAAALHAHGQQLAVTVPASTGDMSTGWSGAFDDRAIGQAADWVVVMAYGYRTAQSSQPGPIAPLPWFSSVTAHVASEVLAEKLIIGIGVWGYDWNVSQPGKANVLRYSDALELMSRYPGTLSYDTTAASARYSYQAHGVAHQVWFEDPSGLQQKIMAALQVHAAGVAFWRLGQEPSALWRNLDAPRVGDFAIPNGWFFTQTGGDTGLGYRVTDEGGVQFWSEFRRLGGVAVLGYPVSRRYVGTDGFTYQVFQRGVLQWRPELGVAYLANTFEQLSAAGQDNRLSALGIPLPIRDDGSGGDWNRARETRLKWLTNPAIRATYFANPNPGTIRSWNLEQSIQLYGLPSSLPVQSGPFIVQRFQRVSLQLWTENVPGMPPKGSVVGILGGDLLKGAGLIPPEAVAPESPF